MKGYHLLKNGNIDLLVDSLGDRHLENILLDVVSGDVVHVDFNCLFEKVNQCYGFLSPLTQLTVVECREKHSKHQNVFRSALRTISWMRLV